MRPCASASRHSGRPGAVLHAAAAAHTAVNVQVSLVGQWVSEARSKLSNQSLKVQEYHGGNRPRSVALLAGQDVVVTTYETLVSDMQGRSKKVKGDANPLARVKWWRIVLDESHAVKDLSSKALSAVRNVQVRPREPARSGGRSRPEGPKLRRGHAQAERRWACSGTPINTDVKDLSGQFAALHMEPLASLQFQAAYLKNGLVTSPRTIFFLLRNLMIRHSKAAVEASGAMRLPPKTEEVVHVDFRQEEWELYAKTHAAARAEFDQFASVGPSYCLTHTLSIMALLMPLRRLCSGGAFSAKPTVANVRLKQHEQIVARAAQLGAAAVAAGAVGADGAIPPAAEEVRTAILSYPLRVCTRSAVWLQIVQPDDRPARAAAVLPSGRRGGVQHLHGRLRGAAAHAVRPLVLQRVHPAGAAAAQLVPALPPRAHFSCASSRGCLSRTHPRARARAGAQARGGGGGG